MDLLNFTIDNLALLGTLTMEHISLVALAVGLAILTGVPIGIL
ncbi:choline ABC transporter permease, partial [Vibrio diabolicus]